VSAEGLWAGLCAAGLGAGGVAAMLPGPGGPLPTTLDDFFGPGTQPETLVQPLVDAQSCRFCHGDYDEEVEPFERWAASMMGQATRDPIFHACLAIANQDAAFGGDTCLRCHAPNGWLEGRSEPTDGTALIGTDFQGVSCSVCHRMVDPIYVEGNPPIDLEVLGLLDDLPVHEHTGQFVIDHMDRRRGPFELDEKFPWHQWVQSPYHQSSNMCANCHEVSNPLFTRQEDGTYAFNEIGVEHPTHNKYDEFPLERTWSEWAQSEFAEGPIDLGGRFGGNKQEVSSCQDCHMPDTSGTACVPGFGGMYRDDLPQHNFNGANSWVLGAIHEMYPDDETFLTDESVAGSIARNKEMLGLAADLDVTASEGELTVRVTNFTGHKLPTGYPEGRRMWVNVKFLDGRGEVLDERGYYDFESATLYGDDTKVYEARLGLDDAMAAMTGLPAGESFHFVLNNMYVKDNRIPPMGFTNAGFEMVQAAPVGYAYADGQHWDETVYELPRGAAEAEVTLYHQTTSREYIEFLRDENVTNDEGQVAYDLWMAHGRSEPVVMGSKTIELAGCAADVNGDGVLNVLDFVYFQLAWQGKEAAGDCDGNGVWNVIDFVCFQQVFVAGCG
jgi:hypothetical protein